MVDPPTYRAAPDPEFADRLERVLLQRLTAPAGSRTRRGVAHSDEPVRTDTDPDESEGDVIMLETEDRPTGNEPASPRHRSPGQWLLVAAAVALVALVGALVAAGGDDDENKVDTVTSTPVRPQPQDATEFTGGPIEPGSYFVDPDGDPSTPLRVTFEVAAEGWGGWLGTYKEPPGSGRVMLSITTVDNVVREACSDQRPAEPAVGPTVDDLAAALSSLAPFALTSPPSDVTVAGYHGKHLELTVPELRVLNGLFADCTGGNLHSWISPLLGDSGFSGYEQLPGATEEFWILDVDGTRLVLVTDQSPTSSAEDLAEMDAIFDSIRIQP